MNVYTTPPDGWMPISHIAKECDTHENTVRKCAHKIPGVRPQIRRYLNPATKRYSVYLPVGIENEYPQLVGAGLILIGLLLGTLL